MTQEKVSVSSSAAVVWIDTAIEDLSYTFRWGNNSKRAQLKGLRCKVLARGKMNSCLVEFKDGQKEIVSRNALRKAK